MGIFDDEDGIESGDYLNALPSLLPPGYEEEEPAVEEPAAEEPAAEEKPTIPPMYSISQDQFEALLKLRQSESQTPAQPQQPEVQAPWGNEDPAKWMLHADGASAEERGKHFLTRAEQIADYRVQQALGPVMGALNHLYGEQARLSQVASGASPEEIKKATEYISSGQINDHALALKMARLELGTSDQKEEQKTPARKTPIPRDASATPGRTPAKIGSPKKPERIETATDFERAYARNIRRVLNKQG